MTTSAPVFLFDLDGTLVDNMPFHAQVWLDFFAEKGVIEELHAFQVRTAGQTTPEILRLYLGADLPPQIVQEHQRQKELRYRQSYAEHFQPVAGGADFVRAARAQGIPLGLATAAPFDNVTFTLDRLRLSGAFDAIVHGDEVRRGKPDPEVYLKAAHKLGASPADCIVFEDSPGGVQAAHAAGMQSVVIRTSLSDAAARALPGVLHTLPDFCGVHPTQVTALWHAVRAG